MSNTWWAAIVAFFTGAWAMWEVKFLLAHIVINVVVAVAAALHVGDFQLAKIGEFLYKKILPYLAVWIVAKAMGEMANMVWLALAVFAVLELNLIGDLADNLSKLGVPMPGFLTKADIFHA